MEKFSNLLLPFKELLPTDKIIVYGSGDVGQTFVHQLKYCGYELVAIVDKIWAGKKLPFPFSGPERILEFEFDKILISVGNIDSAREIKSQLCSAGVAEQKIILPHAGSKLTFNICHKPDVHTDWVDKEKSFARLIAEQCNFAWNDSELQSKIESSEKKVETNPHGVLIVGTGMMAAQMADTINRRLPELTVYGVVSRDFERGKAFSEKYGIKNVFTRCEEAASDGGYDIAYIATPVFLHRDQAVLFLNNGKHVICEKPFAINLAQVQEMIETARHRKLFLMDGLWPRYTPMAKKIKEIIDSRKLGQINGLSANLHYPGLAAPRLSQRAMGGGGLIENGCYLIALCALVFGYDVKKILAAGILTKEMVDCEVGLILQYRDAVACLSVGIEGVSDRKATIYGEYGYLCIDKANDYSAVRVYDNKGILSETYILPHGYEYEMRSALEAIEKNLLCPNEYTFDDSKFVFTILDEARSQIGIRYDVDL